MSRYIRYGLVSVALVLTLSYCLKVSIADEATKYYEAGLDQYKKGWYDQAIREFEKAIELKQDYVSAHYGLGNAYYCKHLYDKAIKEYNKVLRYNPDHAKAHYALWLSYRALGMTGDADRELELYKKLSGQEGAQKEASSSSSPSEKGDYTSSEERTTSWHAAESQAQVEAKTPPASTSPIETQKQEASVPQKQPEESVKKQESPPAQQERSEEAVKKPEDSNSLAQMLAQLEQRQKESTPTTSAVQPAPGEQPGKGAEISYFKSKAAQTETPEQPPKAKEGAIETHKQAEAQAVAPGQPVVTEQPSVTGKVDVNVEHGTAPQHTPTPVKAVEQGQASGAIESKVPAPNQSGTGLAEVKESHIAVEKPRERAGKPGIKVRMEHIWKNAPMGKVIVSIVIYIFVAQVWIGIVATLGLLFLKKSR